MSLRHNLPSFCREMGDGGGWAVWGLLGRPTPPACRLAGILHAPHAPCMPLHSPVRNLHALSTPPACCPGRGLCLPCPLPFQTLQRCWECCYTLRPGLGVVGGRLFVWLARLASACTPWRTLRVPFLSLLLRTCLATCSGLVFFRFFVLRVH